MSKLIKGKYTILADRFRDSISRTYSASSQQNDRLLITQYDPKIVDATRIQTMIDHAERLLGLDLPHVLNLIDYFYDGSSFYAIYDNSQSVSPLFNHLRDNPRFPLPEYIQWCKELLIGIETLERNGLFHGNICFNSVMISASGHLCLLHSFLHQAALPKAVSTLQKLDSVLFLAPEQLLENRYNSKNDIYGFGMMAYLLFANSWPFEFTTDVDKAKSYITTPQKPFRSVDPNCPATIETVITKCLSTSAERRFPSVNAVLTYFNQPNPPKTTIDALTEEPEQNGIEVPQISKWELTLQRVFSWSPTRTKWAVGICTGLIVIFIINYFFVSYITGIPERTVPDVRGLRLQDAIDALERDNLRSQVSGDRVDYTVPEGTVLEVRPTAGTTVKENRIILLFVSRHNNEFKMPDLVGRSISEASQLLPNPKMPIKITDEVASLSSPPGEILSQTPTANEMVSMNTQITATISRGFPISVQGKMDGDNCLVTIQFSVAPNWPEQAVKVVYKSANNMKQLYSNVIPPGENANIDVSLKIPGEVLVYFNSRLAFQKAIKDILSDSNE